MRFGYTLGAGVEYQITPALTAKAEYLYADFGKNSKVATDFAFRRRLRVEVPQ